MSKSIIFTVAVIVIAVLRGLQIKLLNNLAKNQFYCRIRHVKVFQRGALPQLIGTLSHQALPTKSLIRFLSLKSSIGASTAHSSE